MRSLIERKLFLVIITLSLALMLGGSALGQKIRVVATIPDLADITRQIGKDRVSVETLTQGDTFLFAGRVLRPQAGEEVR